MMNEPQSLTGGDKLLTVPEIANEMRTARKTVYRRIQADALKGVFKEGGRWVIWRSRLHSYLKKEENHAPASDRA